MRIACNRWLVRGTIALATSILALASAHADIFHYNNILPGGKAAQMGGAYTALADDVSGIFYNPAGLGFLKANEFSGSAQGQYSNNEIYKNALGDDDFVETARRSFAPFLGSVFNTNKYLRGTVAGFNLYTTDSLAKKQNTLIANQPFNDLTIKRYYRVVNASAETSVKAGGIAKRWGRLSVGLAVGLLTVEEIYQSLQKSELLEQRNGATVNNLVIESLFQQINLTAIEPVVGALIKLPGRTSLGISLRKAVLLSEEVIVEGDTTKAVLDEQDNVEPNSEERKEVLKIVDARLGNDYIKSWPLNLRMGVARKLGRRLTLALDLNQSFAAQGGREEFNRQAVSNMHLGGEFLVLPTLAVRSGVFTNLDSRPRLQATKNNQDDHVDFVGFALAGEYRHDKKSSYALGLNYQRGSGKGQKIQSSDGSPAPLQTIEANKFAVLIAITTELNEEKVSSQTRK